MILGYPHLWQPPVGQSQDIFFCESHLEAFSTDRCADSVKQMYSIGTMVKLGLSPYVRGR